MAEEMIRFALRDLRTAAGISISDLARRSGVSRATIYKIENNNSVKKTTIFRILEYIQKISSNEEVNNIINYFFQNQYTIRNTSNVFVDDFLLELKIICSKFEIVEEKIDSLIETKISRNKRIELTNTLDKIKRKIQFSGSSIY